MRNFFMFMIFFIIYNFGKESIAENVKECAEFRKIHFKQVEGTSGDYDEVIARGTQFVVLQNKNLTIFESYLKTIIRKSLPSSAKRLNLDVFNNIVFTLKNRSGIYIPENDEFIWKGHLEKNIIPFTMDGNLAFDDYNTIYAIVNSGISYAKNSDIDFKFLPRLKHFTNVTRLVDGDRNNFYFVVDSKKTSWIVNGATEQTILQTSSIKHLNYVSNNYQLANGTIYFIDQNCTMKAFKVSPRFIVFKHYNLDLMKIAHFEDCSYRPDTKFIFRPEEFSQLSYFFNKNKIYRLSMEGDSHPKVCLHAKLENVTINAGAVNSDYIMLATTNGLWISKW